MKHYVDELAKRDGTFPIVQKLEIGGSSDMHWLFSICIWISVRNAKLFELRLKLIQDAPKLSKKIEKRIFRNDLHYYVIILTAQDDIPNYVQYINTRIGKRLAKVCLSRHTRKGEHTIISTFNDVCEGAKIQKLEVAVKGLSKDYAYVFVIALYYCI